MFEMKTIALTEKELEAGLAYLLAFKADALHPDNPAVLESCEEARYHFVDTVTSTKSERPF
jgi:hypothetical protein